MSTIRFSIARVPAFAGAGGGAAFFVAPAGRLVTCAHVAAEAVDPDGFIRLVVPDFRLGGSAVELTARWLRDETAEAVDLAVLELQDPLPDGVELLALCDYSLASRDEILSYGFPIVREEFGDPAGGEVVGLSCDPSTGREVLTVRSDELTGGFSGAPIVDVQTGCAVAVMSSTLNEDERGRFSSHAWCVPGSAFSTISGLVRIQPHPVVSELRRLATERIPSILDFALNPDSTQRLMPMTLQRISTEGSLFDEAPTSTADLFSIVERQSPGLVVFRGVAGSGKSTLLRGVLAPGLAVRPGARVPIYLRAQALAAAPPGGGIAARIALALAASSTIAFPAPALHAHLQRLLDDPHQRFVLLVDGLDEVPSTSARSELARDLAEWESGLEKQGHALVVTSKPCMEIKQLSKSVGAISTFEVAPFDDEELAAYFSGVMGEDSGELLSKFRRSIGGGLVGHALLAALAASIGTIPDSIVELYEDYLHLILRRLQAAGGDNAFSAEESLQVLSNASMLAYASLRVDTFDERHAARALAAEFRRHGGLAAGMETLLARAALDRLLDSHSVLYREGSLLRWSHQSIRDYLAGRFLASRLAGPEWAEALTRRNESTWRATILFTLLVASQDNPLGETELLPLGVGGESLPDDADIDLLTLLLLSDTALTSQMLEDAIDTVLFAGLAGLGDFDKCETLFRTYDHPLRQLIRLRAVHPGVEGRLLAVIEDASLDEGRRQALARAVFDHD